IYYDENSLPAQFKDALSVTGIFLQKDFRLGGLNLKNRVLLQWSSSQKVAPVPLVSANAMYYYEFNVVKNVLRMQVGVDAYFNTSYYGFGYNPAIMQFYNQQTTKTGDYIWLDAFVSGKWKRVRFLVKMQHLNYELFGGRNYFQVAHYPLNRRMLKLGISWNFYD
ncbi:MAG: putative porin, partial [Rikenellaceae bacterium]